ncbi:MAG: hypothetical protein L0Y72_12820 [Gemmataceae bacterium]|nr:hypothetical protein [Gemmataceae bacterium]MCI0739922.1 hypothetical protein [Gemmataceae bacterium]
MAFDWMQFLELAHHLKTKAQTDSANKEACYRSAVSRAYYAAFGYAHKFARTWLGFRGKSRPEEKSQEHGALRAFLKNKKRRRVSEKLEFLRSWRNLADYVEEAMADWQKESETALEAAEYVFLALPTPKSNPNGK